MSNRTLEQTGSCVAHADDGRAFTIIELTEFLSGHTSKGPHRVEGHKRYVTSNDEGVNKLAKGEYEIVTLGIIVRCPEANAI